MNPKGKSTLIHYYFFIYQIMVLFKQKTTNSENVKPGHKQMVRDAI